MRSSNNHRKCLIIRNCHIWCLINTSDLFSGSFSFVILRCLIIRNCVQKMTQCETTYTKSRSISQKKKNKKKNPRVRWCIFRKKSYKVFCLFNWGGSKLERYILPFIITVPNIPRKLNIAPYPYKNKFCNS